MDKMTKPQKVRTHLVSGLLLLGITQLGQETHAAAPQCHSHPSGAYCSYSGKIRYAYVNPSYIMIYFDTAVDLNEVASVGIIGVSNGAACAFKVTENPEFARMLYASALAAQSQRKSVELQFREATENGYL